MSNLHHRQSGEASQPGDMVYDDVFTLRNHKFYIIVPPPEQRELFEQVIEIHEGARQLAGKSLELLQDAHALGTTAESVESASRAIKTVYDTVIGTMVVAWEFPDGTVRPFAPGVLDHLSNSAKADISEKLIELLKLWLMAL
jgi:hypothetical protein